MNIKIYEKPVIIKHATVDNYTFELHRLLRCLEQIQHTGENDLYGDYSLREYEIDYPNEMDKLVKMGLVKNFIGPRQANLYCMKDKQKILDLESELYELDVKKLYEKKS